MAVGKNQSISKMSPRQKMINLMYIVLTAMLALNVSSDVLNSFVQVHQSLLRTYNTLTSRNDLLLTELGMLYQKFPDTAKEPYAKGTLLHNETQELCAYIDSLKMDIARACDGPTGRPDSLRNLDDLDAAARVMLPPTSNRGAQLRARIDKYRAYVMGLLEDPNKQKNVESALLTGPVTTEQGTKKWEESLFEGIPAIASVTMLSKLENDVRFAEGVVLNALLMMTNPDTGERINISPDLVGGNTVQAFVCPQSRIVMRGTKYSANIVMATIDPTQRPRVYVNGRQLNNDQGLYEVTTGSTGHFTYSGYIEVTAHDGSVLKSQFQSDYTVIEPMATISPTMMNVFYAGIDNPVAISVSGVPQESISASMTGGSLTKSGNGWIARSSSIGSYCTINVTAMVDGRQMNVGSASFRVRKLPDPIAFIETTNDAGQAMQYKGGKMLSKAKLLAAKGLDAAIDDDILRIDYRVVSFEMVLFDQMGNAMSESSSGANFSSRMREAMKQMRHGRRFYFSRIKATGPDGIIRDIAPLDVIVN